MLCNYDSWKITVEAHNYAKIMQQCFTLRNYVSWKFTVYLHIYKIQEL